MTRVSNQLTWAGAQMLHPRGVGGDPASSSCEMENTHGKTAKQRRCSLLMESFPWAESKVASTGAVFS